MSGNWFFAYMAALAYHVILKEVEQHIFKNNWIFRHSCIYKQPTLTKKWNFNTFEQILYSYFRYTGRLFLGYALFVARCNTIRTSWETKKERLSCRTKCMKRIFVRDITFLTAHSPFYVFLLFSLSTPSPFPNNTLVEWLLQRYIYCYEWYSVWWYHG